jgi:outer membrane protein assembly factor BamA
MRGYDYLQFAGQNVVFANAELRFPLIEAALTPIGVVGGIRGVFFFDIGGGWFKGQRSPAVDVCPSAGASFRFFTRNDVVCRPVVRFLPNEAGQLVPVYGAPTEVSGFRLQDGRASYGVGLETFVLGFPIHFDWSWRTLFNRQWEDVLFAADGGSSAFRKARFAIWVGYDF